MSNATKNGPAPKQRFYDFEEALKASGMTQAEVARLVGKTPAYISRLKTRQFRPSARMIVKFDDLLGVDARAYR